MRIFEKLRYEDKELGVIKRSSGLWILPIEFQGEKIKVRFLGSDYFGPYKRALLNWKNYRTTIDDVWSKAKPKINSIFNEEKYSWAGNETEYMFLDIIAYDHKKIKGIELAIAFEVLQDRGYFYNAYFKSGELNELERCNY